MNVPLTPQLLGDLIEKGFTYVLASVAFDEADTESSPLVLKPVKAEPALTNLPEGFQTYYKITREPLQMVCGDTPIVLQYDAVTAGDGSSSIYDDTYFRMSEEFFRQVIDSLEDYAVFTTDTIGNVNSWNNGAQKVLGYSEQEILGINSEIFFIPEDREKNEPVKELKTASADGRAIDERYHLRKDGSRFWGSGLVFPLYDESHKHRGYTKIMRNLREEENAREAVNV